MKPAPPIAWCRRCLLPSTKPDLQFDAAGVCSACLAFDRRAGIDWSERRAQLDALFTDAAIAAARAKSPWDVLVPVSGGKDSHFQVITALDAGLRPLCVCFEPSVPTALGARNLANLQRLGVDLLHWRKNPQTYRKMARIGLRLVGDHEVPNHRAIFTVPVRYAALHQIPLVLWGENSQAEYGGPEEAQRQSDLDRRWLEEYGGLLGLRLEDMIGQEGLTRRDLLPYEYPSPEALRGVRGIFLGHFIPWDAVAQLEVVQTRGFEVGAEPTPGTYTRYENLDCATTWAHDALKFAKYGFGRASDHASLDIRHGRITRARGLELVRAYDGGFPWGRLPELAAFLDMDPGEVRDAMDGFVNPALFAFDGDRPARDADGNWIPLFEVC